MSGRARPSRPPDVQRFVTEGKPALVVAFVRSSILARLSSNTTVAVFSLNETVALETPETRSRVFLTMYGQASQYMLSTVKVTVRCSANAALEDMRTSPTAATTPNFIIEVSVMS